MPTTTNFGWTTPADTDLVKDGALAIRTLGNGVDTSFLDLKGGATGDSLVKASATDLDYNWTRLADQVLANPVINGGMDIWQRGTSIAGTTSAYSADRWLSYRGATGSTFTRQTTGDTTNLPNIQYCARIARDSGNTSTTDIYFSQSFETVNSIPFAGKTVTMSYYARRGANFSMASNTLTVKLSTGTGTDQNRITSGYTGNTDNNFTALLTTTWQRFAHTVTIPTTATEIAVWFAFAPVGTAGAADYFEVTGVQLDVGTFTAANAPAFRRSGGTIQGELAACQRYYWRISGDEGGNAVIGNGVAETTAQYDILVNHPTSMRVTPTSIDYSGLRIVTIGTGVGVVTTPTSITISSSNSGKSKSLILFTKTASFTVGNTGWLSCNSGTDYFGLSAEL